MHLFYLNVVPNMRDHWQGNFFSWERQPGAFDTAQQAKFKPSGEPYCVAPEEWKRIDQDIKSMIHPAVFGDRIRGVQEFRKANQWKTWAQVVSPIVLKNRLPEPFYSAWTQLVHGMTLATDYSVTAKDITDIRESMIQFVNHYHEVYYRYQNKRLPACRAVFHALLHVAECVEWLGPMWSYSQWVVERMFGLWTPKVKQRASASRNLSLAMLRSSLISNLKYGADLTARSCSTIPCPINSEDERITENDEISVLLDGLRGISNADDNNGMPRYCWDENHQSTLHHRIRPPMPLSIAQLIKLNSYLHGLDLMLPLTVNLSAEIGGGGRTKNAKKNDSLTNVKVDIWQKCLLRDPNAPQSLYRSYIRSAAYEKAGARDSTYVRYELIQEKVDTNGSPVCCTVGKFGRVLFFCEFNGWQPSTRAPYHLLLAWVEEVPVVGEVVAAGTLYRVKESPTRAVNDSSDLRYFINVDSISCLTGMVSVTVSGSKSAQYMIEKDSCFL
jgi:hypothetical protein